MLTLMLMLMLMLIVVLAFAFVRLLSFFRNLIDDDAAGAKSDIEEGNSSFLLLCMSSVSQVIMVKKWLSDWLMLEKCKQRALW